MDKKVTQSRYLNSLRKNNEICHILQATLALKTNIFATQNMAIIRGGF